MFNLKILSGWSLRDIRIAALIAVKYTREKKKLIYLKLSVFSAVLETDRRYVNVERAYNVK